MKRPIILGILIVSLLSITVLGARRLIEQNRTAAEITRLRDSLYRARITANRCQQNLAANESALQLFDERLDSLRARVDSFEALDPRGVPQPVYGSYMEVLETYNDSAATWDAREQQLRLQDASCRGVIDGHNAVRDSLAAVLAEAGIAAD